MSKQVGEKEWQKKKERKKEEREVKTGHVQRKEQGQQNKTRRVMRIAFQFRQGRQIGLRCFLHPQSQSESGSGLTIPSSLFYYYFGGGGMMISSVWGMEKKKRGVVPGVRYLKR